MNKFWTIAVIAVVAAAGAGAVLALNSQGQQKELKDKETAESTRVVDVKFVQPRKGALERVCVQPGSVHSFERIQLFAKVPGYLEYQKVDIGSLVKGPVRALFGNPIQEV